jgi:hypothetical protein
MTDSAVYKMAFGLPIRGFVDRSYENAWAIAGSPLVAKQSQLKIQPTILRSSCDEHF